MFLHIYTMSVRASIENVIQNHNNSKMQFRDKRLQLFLGFYIKLLKCPDLNKTQ